MQCYVFLYIFCSQNQDQILQDPISRHQQFHALLCIPLHIVSPESEIHVFRPIDRLLDFIHSSMYSLVSGVQNKYFLTYFQTSQVLLHSSIYSCTSRVRNNISRPVCGHPSSCTLLHVFLCILCPCSLEYICPNQFPDIPSSYTLLHVFLVLL
jgi:hypothetical protein